jgi:hypothetical protein
VTAAVSLATSPTVTAASASIAADAPYQPTLPLTVVSPNDLAGTIIPPSAVQRYWTLTVTSKSVLPAYLLSGQVSIPARGITGSLDCNLAATLPVSLLPKAGRSLHGHVQMGGVVRMVAVSHTQALWGLRHAGNLVALLGNLLALVPAVPVHACSRGCMHPMGTGPWQVCTALCESGFANGFILHPGPPRTWRCSVTRAPCSPFTVMPSLLAPILCRALLAAPTSLCPPPSLSAASSSSLPGGC